MSIFLKQQQLQLSSRSFGKLLIASVTASYLSFIPAQTIAASEISSQINDQLTQELYQGFANTGDNTSQNSQHQTTTATNADLSNQATVNQSVNAEANTGYNEASRNISIGGNAGIINTGDALVNTTTAVEVNRIQAQVGGALNHGGAQHSITNTGDGVNTTSDTQQNSHTVLTGLNNALISQSSNSLANTGHNRADRNISIGGQAGVITTGQAGVATNFLVAGNNSVMLVGGESDGNGPGSGASIVRANTGNQNTFSFAQEFNEQLQTTTQNNATVNQSCGAGQQPCSAITGYNSSNRGISKGGNVGVINTAPALIDLSFFAAVNTNQANVPSRNHSLQHQAQTFNTGDHVNSDTNQTSNQQTNLSLSNQAQVNQQAFAKADTGHNTANRNISIGGDAGIITTGDALVNIVMFALVNPIASVISS